MSGFREITDVIGENVGDHQTDNKMYIEVASAITYEKEEFEKTVDSLLSSESVISLFIQGELKELGSKDPASNFRQKHDIIENNNVVSNLKLLMEKYSLLFGKPIVISTVGRHDRYLSFFIEESGRIVATDSRDCQSGAFTRTMNSFQEKHGLTGQTMVKMRNACMGSRYKTYMADVLSFVFIIDSIYFPEMWEIVKKKPVIYKSSDIPNVMNKDSTQWSSKDGFDYLYFESSDDSESLEFLVPKKGVVGKVYSQILQLLSTSENGFKEMVRRSLKDNVRYLRFSDYLVNDIDDVITIFAILNAFSYCELDSDERMMKENLEQIAKKIVA